MSRAVARSYATIWMATAAGAGLGLLGLRLLSTAAPYDALSANTSTAVSLLAANAAVALWPLALIAIGWHRHSGLAAIAEVLTRSQLLGNGLIVGNAIAQHPALLRYLPHLPLEWAAISTPVAAWSTSRADGTAPVVRTAAIAVLALAGAAIVETYLVPLG